jgi:hypothetical protein
MLLKWNQDTIDSKDVSVRTPSAARISIWLKTKREYLLLGGDKVSRRQCSGLGTGDQKARGSGETILGNLGRSSEENYWILASGKENYWILAYDWINLPSRKSSRDENTLIVPTPSSIAGTATVAFAALPLQPEVSFLPPGVDLWQQNIRRWITHPLGG